MGMLVWSSAVIVLPVRSSFMTKGLMLCVSAQRLALSKLCTLDFPNHLVMSRTECRSSSTEQFCFKFVVQGLAFVH